MSKEFEYTNMTGVKGVARLCERHGGHNPPLGYLPAEHKPHYSRAWFPIYIPISWLRADGVEFTEDSQ